jgi:hypothetical protein
MPGILDPHINVGADLAHDPAEQEALAKEDYKAAMAYRLDNMKLGIEQDRVGNDNTANARSAYVAIQESSSASRLAKNIQPILAFIVITVSVFSPAIIWLAGDLNEASRQTLNSAIGNINNLSLLVLGFYFGAAKRDQDLDKALLTATPHPEHKL